MTGVNYDEIANEYDRRYELHDYPGIRSTIRRVAKPQKGARILEVGCGTGRWLAELAFLGCNVAGADVSAEMLKLASARFTGDLRQASAESDSRSPPN